MLYLIVIGRVRRVERERKALMTGVRQPGIMMVFRLVLS